MRGLRHYRLHDARLKSYLLGIFYCVLCTLLNKYFEICTVLNSCVISDNKLDEIKDWQADIELACGCM